MALPEVFFAGDVAPATANRMVRDGRAMRLARGIYTTDTRRAPDAVVRRHWQRIVAHVLPGAVVVDRSARDLHPVDGLLFVDAGRDTPIELPGLTIVPRRGPGPLQGDVRAGADDLWFSSVARGLADNTVRSRAVPRKGRPPRTLTEAELADWIDHLAAHDGTDRLRRLRREVAAVAPVAGRARTVVVADRLIGAALGTRTVETGSERLRARQRRAPYDAERFVLFEALAEELRATAPRSIVARAEDAPRRAVLPFFEAYFSNFIEGTELTLDEAERVVFQGDDVGRPADAHDVLATYEVVADDRVMARRPHSAQDLADVLIDRHRLIMARRPDAFPGQWKTRNNQAGGRAFVAPELVVGTLNAGWRLLETLDEPFGRAVFSMFLVTEVHPFVDGNGRVARILMNSELVAEGEWRIVIPTGYRTDYLAGLSALSRNAARGRALIRVLDFAQRYTAQVDWSSLETATRDLAATNAFATPEDARDHGIRLRLPSSLGTDDPAV